MLFIEITDNRRRVLINLEQIVDILLVPDGNGLYMIQAPEQRFFVSKADLARILKHLPIAR